MKQSDFKTTMGIWEIMGGKLLGTNDKYDIRTRQHFNPAANNKSD